MFLDDLLSSGSIPALEATLRFAGARQQVINHNIANLETPNFRPMDVSPQGFQTALAQAVQQRRQAGGGMAGSLDLGSSDEISMDPSGEMILAPKTESGNILFHDRSNSDLERVMQANAENAMVYKMTGELLRSRYSMLRDAMAERV